MHQHFEPEDRPHRSPFRRGDASHYWEMYCRGYGTDPDIARDRLDALRWEQERNVFNPNDMQLPDEPLFYTRTHHTLDFKCQCKNCTKLHTITMQDAAFLRAIGVAWRIPPNIAEPSQPTQDQPQAEPEPNCIDHTADHGSTL